MEILLDGREIRTESAFHDRIAEAASAAGFDGYGRNLDALWDTLTGILPLPLSIHWVRSGASRAAMGPTFDKLVGVIREAEAELGPSHFKVRVQP